MLSIGRGLTPRRLAAVAPLVSAILLTGNGCDTGGTAPRSQRDCGEPSDFVNGVPLFDKYYDPTTGQCVGKDQLAASQDVEATTDRSSLSYFSQHGDKPRLVEVVFRPGAGTSASSPELFASLGQAETHLVGVFVRVGGTTTRTGIPVAPPAPFAVVLQTLPERVASRYEPLVARGTYAPSFLEDLKASILANKYELTSAFLVARPSDLLQTWQDAPMSITRINPQAQLSPPN